MPGRAGCLNPPGFEQRCVAAPPPTDHGGEVKSGANRSICHRSAQDGASAGPVDHDKPETAMWGKGSTHLVGKTPSGSILPPALPSEFTTAAEANEETEEGEIPGTYRSQNGVGIAPVSGRVPSTEGCPANAFRPPHRAVFRTEHLPASRWGVAESEELPCFLERGIEWAWSRRLRGRDMQADDEPGPGVRCIAESRRWG